MTPRPHAQRLTPGPASALGRRAFLKAGLAAGAGALTGCEAGAERAAKSRVVEAHSEKVFADGGGLDFRATRHLVDAAVARLVGETRATEAWKRLVGPDDVVGIKVNCLAGRRLSTRIEVVRAVADGVRRAGVKPERIVVWDRKLNDLVRAAYPVRDHSDFVCIGNDHRKYGYGGRLVLEGEIGSLFSRLVTRYCSVIINVPVFKDHDLAGVTLGLKSAFGAIHNPNKYHFANLHQAIVDVNKVAALRKKTVLHLCDATFGCYHGGPTPSPRYIERLGTVYAARDPVALDFCAWQRIEALRKAKGQPPLAEAERKPDHIAIGARESLGTDEPTHMELVKLEV
ncbi:MAG: DUF362 domain-containing protein [Candidatus Brocadiia bacterium]